MVRFPPTSSRVVYKVSPQYSSLSEPRSGDRSQQHQRIAEGITDTIVTSTGTPVESVNVLSNEVWVDSYALGGTALSKLA